MAPVNPIFNEGGIRLEFAVSIQHPIKGLMIRVKGMKVKDQLMKS